MSTLTATNSATGSTPGSAYGLPGCRRSGGRRLADAGPAARGTVTAAHVALASGSLGMLSYFGGETLNAWGMQLSCSDTERLVSEAQRRYPNLAGRIHQHHILLRYLDPAGVGARSTVPIDAAYHQLITNASRQRFPYGQGPYDPIEVNQFLEQLYRMYPLPGNSPIPGSP